MARKRAQGEVGVSLDSLMDTVTNVVGVLMIVLIMVSLNIANSVNKILSDLPPVTPDQLAKLKKEVLDATPKQEPKKVEEERKKLDEDLKKVVEELKTLDTRAEKQKIKPIDLDSLKKQISERAKVRDTKKSDVEKLLAEIDTLKARLDATPVYTPPSATVVKLPNPRPMPENANVERFLVAGNRVIYLNENGFVNLLQDELEKNEKALLFREETVKDAAGKPVMVKDKRGRTAPKVRTIYDPKKVADYFSRGRVGTREIKLDMALSPNSPRVIFKLNPQPGAGEDLAQMGNPASVFQRLLRKFKSEPNTVVWFEVFKDSLQTYLAARDMVDQVGVPAGWELYGNNFFQRSLGADYEVNFTPPKPVPPSATPTVRIAPPKTTLD